MLPKGTYEIRGRDPGGANAHQSRLQKFPGDVTILMGSSEIGTAASVLEGKFTIAQPASFEFQNFCSNESGNIPPFPTLDDNILGFVQLWLCSGAADPTPFKNGAMRTIAALLASKRKQA